MKNNKANAKRWIKNNLIGDKRELTNDQLADLFVRYVLHTGRVYTFNEVDKLYDNAFEYGVLSVNNIPHDSLSDDFKECINRIENNLNK